MVKQSEFIELSCPRAQSMTQSKSWENQWDYREKKPCLLKISTCMFERFLWLNTPPMPSPKTCSCSMAPDLTTLSPLGHPTQKPGNALGLLFLPYPSYLGNSPVQLTLPSMHFISYIAFSPALGSHIWFWADSSLSHPSTLRNGKKNTS